MTTTNIEQKKLLTLDEARERLGGISRRSLERLAERGKLRLVRPGGLRRIFVKTTDLERLIR